MEYIKISFLGDIMCEKPFLNSAKKKNGEYDFSGAFKKISHILSQSDYSIGNLETVFAGKEQKYTHELYSFNTPDTFVEVLKEAGINCVSTANNHCLDRGIKGLLRTLDILEQNKIETVGTYRTDREANEVKIIELGGIKFGIVSYTYGTNENINHIYLNKNEEFYVNLLQPQKKDSVSQSKNKIKNYFSIETKTKIKKIIGMPYKNIAEDKMPKVIENSYLKKIEDDIKKLKTKVDHIIFLLHIGGQFNKEPGEYSKFFIKFLKECGVDIIIGNHPHNVQRGIIEKGDISTFCLGNVSISPSSIYVPMENHPDYSLILHSYFGIESKKLEKVTVSMLKIEEKKNGFLTVWPVDELSENVDKNKKIQIYREAKMVLETFLDKNIKEFQMQSEWEVYER